MVFSENSIGKLYSNSMGKISWEIILINLLILYISSNKPISDIKDKRRRKYISIFKNIEDIKIEASIANPPDVDIGVSCIPLSEGAALANGILTSKNANTRVDIKGIKNNIMRYFKYSIAFLYSINTFFLEKFWLTYSNVFSTILEIFF